MYLENFSSVYMKALREAPSTSSQLHDTGPNSTWTKDSLGFCEQNAWESSWQLWKPIAVPWCWRIECCWGLQPPARQKAWNDENLIMVHCQFAKTDRDPQIIPDVMSHPFLTKKEKKKKKRFYWRTSNTFYHSILGMLRNSPVIDFLLFFDLQQNTTTANGAQSSTLQSAGPPSAFPTSISFQGVPLLSS